MPLSVNGGNSLETQLGKRQPPANLVKKAFLRKALTSAVSSLFCKEACTEYDLFIEPLRLSVIGESVEV